MNAPHPALARLRPSIGITPHDWETLVKACSFLQTRTPELHFYRALILLSRTLDQVVEPQNQIRRTASAIDSPLTDPVAESELVTGLGKTVNSLGFDFLESNLGTVSTNIRGDEGWAKMVLMKCYVSYNLSPDGSVGTDRQFGVMSKTVKKALQEMGLYQDLGSWLWVKVLRLAEQFQPRSITVKQVQDLLGSRSVPVDTVWDIVTVILTLCPDRADEFERLLGSLPALKRGDIRSSRAKEFCDIFDETFPTTHHYRPEFMSGMGSIVLEWSRDARISLRLTAKARAGLTAKADECPFFAISGMDLPDEVREDEDEDQSEDEQMDSWDGGIPTPSPSLSPESNTTTTTAATYSALYNQQSSSRSRVTNTAPAYQHSPYTALSPSPSPIQHVRNRRLSSSSTHRAAGAVASTSVRRLSATTAPRTLITPPRIRQLRREL